MSRMFDTHIVRDTKTLDGMWQFKMDGIDKEYTLPVPGCWEQHPDFVSHKGIGTYTKPVYIKKDGNLRLEFKGVSHTADVYFDGKKVTHHYNAYTPFSVILKNVSASNHEIKVTADNRYSEDSSLHVPNDYYSYGGITRPVVLEYLPDSYIKWVHFTPEFDGNWSGRTEVCIANISDTDKTLILKTTLAGTENSCEVVISANSEKTISFENGYENITPWSMENPQLYYLTASIGEDDLIERVGFRTVTFDKTRLILNGKPVYLKGFNRHEDYAEFGCAIPPQLMANDLDLIADTDANAVRTSHYPNDERFLDMCDERGILVWEENHARGLTADQMKNPNFEAQCEDCIREMIENHYNHPSIVIWGILNECASNDPDCSLMYKRQYEQIKSMDKSRPTTSASNKYYTDISLGYPDIVSYNCYTGWYSGTDTRGDLNRLLDWIQGDTEGADKPVIISEFGAGGIYGFRDRTCSKWSEERQREVLIDNLSVYLDNPRLTGMFIWLFADCRIDECRLFMSRPKCQNNKGIVDIYRRPKLAYDTVKSIFKGEKPWEL